MAMSVIHGYHSQHTCAARALGVREVRCTGAPIQQTVELSFCRQLLLNIYHQQMFYSDTVMSTMDVSDQLPMEVIRFFDSTYCACSFAYG